MIWMRICVHENWNPSLKIGGPQYVVQASAAKRELEHMNAREIYLICKI